MITLAFLGALAVIFATVLAMEVTEGDGVRLQRPAGLINWLTGGNWPAKIGGALIVVGVGALLRYALINIELPPQLKLGTGVLIALALGLASTFVPEGAAKRPISLALGGAAFGVVYLTAYSAFALFQYLSSPVGLALLGVTSVAAGVYAITRGAQSLAVLSMVGAFLAPAFAIGDPGPQIVYGYYAGASLLTLGMVTMRGWRPLIHLSFLFTLAGGLFFAWTSQYYDPAHSDVMLPMLLLLAAIHVAMPICENRGGSRRWVEQLDIVYLLALAVVSALLALVIAPDRRYLSAELIALAAIWAVASAVLAALRRNGTAAHAVIAAALLLLGIAARFRDLPWELIGLALAVGALWVASIRRPLGRIHDVLAGTVVLFAALHILGSLASPSTSATFDARPLIERLIAAVFVITAGAICRRIRQSLDTLLLAVGILWSFFAIGAELVRLDLATVSLVAHWFFLLVAGSLWIRGRKVRFADERISLLTLLILATGAWSSLHASETAAWISMVAAGLALIGLALRPPSEEDEAQQDGRIGAALMAPVVTAVWAYRAGSLASISQVVLFSLSCGVAVALITIATARVVKDERTSWLENAANVLAPCFALVVAISTLLHIVRDPSAVTLELLCLVGLAQHALFQRRIGKPVELEVSVCMLGIALVVQANLMRLLGPPGVMNIGDVLTLKWPAVISLLWAMAGCALTIWSRKVQSRVLWVSGATLLVGAAVKLLLLDFGSLGQLANILAVIAAGAVFLLVGWLAPMPPRPESPPEEPKSSPEEPPRPAPPSVQNHATAWKARPQATMDARRSAVSDAYTPARSSQPSPSMAEDAPRPINGWAVMGVIAAAAILALHGGHVLRTYRTLAHAGNEHARTLPPPDAAIEAKVAAAEQAINHGSPTESQTDVAALPPAQIAPPPIETNEAPPVETTAAPRVETSGAPTVERSDAHVPKVNARRAPRAAAGPAPDRAAAESPVVHAEPRAYAPPPTVDAQGVRTYSDYNYQPPAHESRAQSASQQSTSQPSTVPRSTWRPSAPAEKEAGIDQLVREGRLRPATARDVTMWRQATGSSRIPDFRAAGYGYLEPIPRYYVVVREMTYPDGLYGAHAVTFIIPRGVPRPFGEPGHSAVLEMP